MHTDQGTQYRHSSWGDELVVHGAIQSMSRRGNCHDNSIAENNFSHLKAEMYHGEHFDSAQQLIDEIKDYIGWYNTERFQERLGWLTPSEYRERTLGVKPVTTIITL